jgi:hypothetical protein
MKQQTYTPTPKDAPSSAFASAEEMSSLPELQGNHRQGRKEGTDEEMARPPELQGNRGQGPAPKDSPSSAFASAEEMSSIPELQGNHRQERERREMAANDEEEGDESSDEEMRPGAVAVAGPGGAGMAGVVTGRSSPTTPSIYSEPPAPSAMDEDQSTIMGELAGPSPEDEELRRRCEELQQIVDDTVMGTAIVANSGEGDHDKNATSSPSGRKERGFLIGAAFALLLVVGVILGVTIPLTTNNDKNSPLIDSAVTPTQSPTPTEAQRRCTSLDCLAEILLQNEVSDAETLQDESSPQFLALRWLANNDPAVLDLASTPTVILVERYVLAVLYFATSAEGGLNVLNFLTASSVCEWKGVVCNGYDLVVALLLGKSKHGDAIVLISKDCN